MHLTSLARRSRLVVGLALAVTGPAALLAGCGGSGGPDLTVYNGQHVQTTDALVAGFEHQTGLTVAVRSDDEDTLADEIVTEGARSPADVIYTENSPALQFLAGKGLLAQVAPATLAHTPARDNSPDGLWVGVSARVSVLVYNPSLIRRSRLPTSVLDLAEPRYRNMVALAPGETDFQPIVTAVQRKVGTAAALRWLEGLKANAGSHVYPDNETVTSEVNRGVVAMGVINQYYWYRLRAELGPGGMHSAITTFAAGDPGYVIDISPAAVLRSSRHPAAAQRFLAYLTSAQGQEIIARSTSFEYPVASGVTTAQPETPLAALRPDAVSVAALGDGASAIALMQRAGLL